MTALELLAPARNAQIGIAAINCGADAVYIGAEAFGARKDACNPMTEVSELCTYAHKFGARVFLTVNTVIYDHELEQAHAQMLAAQQVGVDAFIIRDPRICEWEDISVPLHASTQCAIRDPQRAKYFEALGCSRIILERELSLEQIEQICKAVSCEVEFFVHGAICVCYSGDCSLSQAIDGRSADRGECIQACRSLYDLEDSNGKVLARNKAVLSLKDYKLLSRLEDLCKAGVSSFKIEGRLKNASYVKNVTREYSLALDKIVSEHPDQYCRASFGQISSGFTPDSNKTFNRSYTQLFLDGKKGQWAAMDAPKSMGEFIGTVLSLRAKDRHSVELRLKLEKPGTVLSNGDGFSFVSKNSIVGFRADLCQDNSIICKDIQGLAPGVKLYRNISVAFEKALENDSPTRELRAALKIKISGKFQIDIHATTEDGRTVDCNFKADVDVAQNRERAQALLLEQLSKRADGILFHVQDLDVNTPGDILPLLSASTINSLRRIIASDINAIPCNRRPLGKGGRDNNWLQNNAVPQKENNGELMRSRYCVRYELGMCPVHQAGKDNSALFLVNNGRRFQLGFDCKNCEMTVKEAQKTV